MSSKTFGKLIKIAGAVLLIGATAGIGIGIIGGLGLGSLGVTLAVPLLGSVSLGAIAAVGFAAYSSGTAMGKRPGALSMNSPGMAARLSVATDPAAPRGILVGEVATSGVLRYRNEMTMRSNGDKVTWIVLVLSGYPCDSLVSATINGVAVTIGGGGAVTTGIYANKLWIHFRDGRATTQAFTEIGVDEGLATSDSADNWTARTRVGRGMCTVAIKVIQSDAFKGRLDPVFTVRGARVYDPRLDSSVGGAGSQTWADETTHVWSRNAVLIKLAYLRGFYWPDSAATQQRIAGRGLLTQASKFDFANWIEAANICAENVAVVGGDVIPRYTADGFIDPLLSHRENINALDSADAGNTVFAGGVYRTFPGAWRAPSLTYTEADIIGAPTRVEFRRGPRERINVVRGSFANRDDGFKVREYPPVLDTASIVRVGERQVTLDLPFTTDHRRAQRIAKIYMLTHNAPRGVTARFTHRALKLAPGGQGINLTYAMYQLSATPMRITEWTLVPMQGKSGAPGLAVDLALVEDSSTYYAWTAASDERSLDVPTQLPATGTRTGYDASYAVRMNVDGANVSNPGELMIVGVDSLGNADFAQDGAVRWNGTRVTIPRTSTNNFTVGTGAAYRSGVILFDTTKPGSPRFTVSGNGVHTVFAWREHNGWFYDNNTTTPVAFTPIQGRDVALGWIETGATDVILDAGAFGQPLPLEQAFDSLSTLMPWTPIMTGVTRHGNTFTKAAPGVGWGDASVHSLETYDACSVRFMARDTTGSLMVALNTDPSTDSSYTSLDHAFYLQGGTLEIYENGSPVVVGLGAYTVTDEFQIHYDGNYVVYLRNGVELRRVPRIGARFALDSAFLTPGTAVTNLQFMALVRTPQMVHYEVHDEFAYGTAAAGSVAPELHRRWTKRQGGVADADITLLSGLTDAPGGQAVRFGNNSGNDEWWGAMTDVLIPFDPTALYEVGVVLRNAVGSNLVYCGVEGVAADRVTMINTVGANAYGSQHYYAAAGLQPGVSTAAWTTYRGYIRGHSAAPTGGGAASPFPQTPGAMYTGVAYIRPSLLVNYTAGAGSVDVAALWVRRISGSLAALNSVSSIGDAPDNLIQNGGGEEGLSATQATYWTHSTGSALTPESDTSRFGLRSLRINNATSLQSYSYQDVSVVAGEVYELSGWVKSNAFQAGAVVPCGAYLNVDAVSGVTSFQVIEKVTQSDPASTEPDIGIQIYGAPFDWTFVRCRFIPQGASGVIRLYCHLGYGATIQGAAWFDGVVLRRMQYAETDDIRPEAATDTASDYEAGPVTASGYEGFDVVQITSASLTAATNYDVFEIAASGRVRSVIAGTPGSVAYYYQLNYRLNGGAWVNIQNVLQSQLNVYASFSLDGLIGPFAAGTVVEAGAFLSPFAAGLYGTADMDAYEVSTVLTQVKR